MSPLPVCVRVEREDRLAPNPQTTRSYYTGVPGQWEWFQWCQGHAFQGLMGRAFCSGLCWEIVVHTVFLTGHWGASRVVRVILEGGVGCSLKSVSSHSLTERTHSLTQRTHGANSRNELTHSLTERTHSPISTYPPTIPKELYRLQEGGAACAHLKPNSSLLL